MEDLLGNGTKVVPRRTSRLFCFRSRTAWLLTLVMFVVSVVVLSGGDHRQRALNTAASVQKNVQNRLTGKWDGTPGTSTVFNRTLGFQKVFAIGLPGRTDKRDALSLAAAYSKLDVEWSDGVMLSDMEEKAIPEAFDDMANHITGGAKAAIIGSWRAHMNVLMRIVNENIQTALILEDDMDWDVNFKAQMEEFARGTSTLQKDTPGNSPRGSPYGNNWDVIWPGHCRVGPSSETQKMYFIHNDTTVPPPPLRTAPWTSRHRPSEVRSVDTRVVFQAASAGCTFAYAVTWEAAQKIVTSLSLTGEGIIYDISMAHMCLGLMISPFKCYSVYPPLFSSHRFAGSASRDSDIRNKGANKHHVERTYDIVYSTIMNLPRLLSGSDSVLSQWPESTPPKRGVHDSYANQIQSEVRELNVKSPPAGSEDVEDFEGFEDLKSLTDLNHLTNPDGFQEEEPEDDLEDDDEADVVEDGDGANDYQEDDDADGLQESDEVEQGDAADEGLQAG